MRMRKSVLFVIFTVFVFGIHAQNYTRIISLAPSITRNLHFLNADNLLVGCTSFCKTPDIEVPVVATAIDVNLERIISLKPDLVFYTSLTKTADVEMMKKLGIKTINCATPRSWEKIGSQFVEIGSLIGKAELAKSIVNNQQQKLDSIEALIPNGNNTKIFIEVGAKPLFGAIPNTYMQDFITLVGAENILNDMKHGTVTREKVLMENPDVIILVTMGLVSEDEKDIWKSFEQLNAAKNNRIYIIDADRACQPTPVDFTESVLEIYNLIYN